MREKINKTLKLSLYIISLIVNIGCVAQKEGYYTSVEEAIKEPQKVKILDVTGEVLTDELYKFIFLEELYVLDGTLDSIKDGIERLDKLKTFSCRSVGLKHISKGFEKLKNLEK